MSKGQRGSKNHQAKICEDDARLIIALLDERRALRKQLKNLTLEKIADKFGASKTMVGHIDTGRTWRHV